jgi:UDP-N-acetylglucosamine--N-acetylmuramyl-(pentapeptide) pyrophosphoryl-undecaprenol N-acetylglucosamine transferase
MITCEALPDLKQLGSELSIIHQTGQKDLDLVRGKYEAAGLQADIRPFLPAIHEEFGRADLILCRAGASTVAELTAAGKAAILVPFPGAADDHQTRNAESLEKIGAAKLIPEKEWAPGRLGKEIRHLMCRRGEVAALGEAARRASRPDAAERIAGLVLSVIEEHKHRKGRPG